MDIILLIVKDISLMMDHKINFSTNSSVFSNIFHCLFGTVKFINNIDLDKYEGSGYGIGFYSRSNISLSNGEFGKKILLLCLEWLIVLLCMLIIDKKNFVFGEGLDKTAIISDAKYSINIAK